MAKFQKGNKAAAGIPRPNAGRKPDWFKAKMRELSTHKEVMKFIEGVLLGKDVDEFITMNGECIPHRAKADTRFKVWADVTDRAFGKATQAIEHTGADGGPIRLEDLIAGSMKDD